MNNAIAPVRGSVVPSREDWSTIFAMAQALVPTGFLPQAIKTPEQAAAVILKGRELGVPPMYALSNITVIQGKPTCNAELMLALVRRDHGSNVIRIKESTNDHCTVQWKAWGEVSEYTFTLDDAKRAGLLSNQTWTKYPAAMLRARCISAVCRMAFPESIAGMYTAEELGGPAALDDEETVSVSGVRANVVTGEIIESSPSAEPETVHETTAASMPMVTQQHFRAIHALKNAKGLTDSAIKQMHGKASAREMTAAEADHLIRYLRELPDIILDEPDDEPAEQAELVSAGDPERWTR